MQIIVDLDGTLCQEMRQFSRCLAKAKPEAVKTINALYDEGNTIIIYTARTWAEYEMTIDWLKNNNVKYNQLFMGKPIGDVWLDDRAMPVENNWENIYNKLSKKKNG
ncbi:MAG: hypothetical protein Q4F97_09840 [Bacteroidales bacterium]|nr:hypothetical protein [Bacteroidales bacterium]